jgi:ADP-ribosylglycohydrolase
VASAAGRRMLDWVNGVWPNRKKGTDPVDIGGATAQGLDAFGSTGETLVEERPTGAGENSAGNGSLMRCIPSAIFDERLDVALRNARRIGVITHTSSMCVGAVSAYVAIAWSLIRGASVSDALSTGLAIAASFPVVYKAIKEGMHVLDLRKLAEKGPTQETLPKLASGWVIESLKLGIAALVDGRDAEEVLVDVVRVGNDTDTNAAIAGGLLGARDGVEGIPRRWRDKCWFKAEFEEIVDEILG